AQGLQPLGFRKNMAARAANSTVDRRRSPDRPASEDLAMAEYKDREHYIPLRKSELVDLLLRDKDMPHDQREPFRQFCRLVEATFHFEYHQRLEALKNAYAPFDPDSETKTLTPAPEDERQQKFEALCTEFVKLMERANFKRLTQEDIKAAIEGGAS